MPNRLKQFFSVDLWDDEVGGPLQRWLYPPLRIILVMWQELAGGQLTLRATSLVYTTLLALVPFLAVSFSVLKAFGAHNQVKPLLLQLLEPLGSRGNDLALQLLQFIDKMKVGVLGAVGVSILLYTLISLTQKVESSFNYVWRVTRERSLPRRFADYLSVIMVGPVLVFAALGLTATLTNSSLVQLALGVPVLGSTIALAGKVLPYVLVIIAFTFVYVFIPNTKVQFKSALVGALISGVLWQSGGMVFAWFVSRSPGYAALYSGLAILMIFMIWLYLSWFILLFGAQISYYHQHPQEIRLRREPFRYSARLKEQAGLMLLALVAEAYRQGKPFWTEEMLAQRMRMPADAVADLVDVLLRYQLLVDTADEVPCYLLARDPALIPLDEVVEILRREEEVKFMVRPQALEHVAVSAVLAQVDAARRHSLAGRTVQDLIPAE